MNVDIRFQISALTFFMIILIDYLKNKRLPVLSTKAFSMMLLFSGFNLIFDIMSVYTINNLDKVSPLFNRVMHQCFIGTLGTLIICFYMYVETLGTNQRRIGKNNRKSLIFFLPYVVLLILLSFGKIDYHVGPDGAYSEGPTVSAFYFMVFFYLINIFISTIRYRNIISKSKRWSIRFGMCIWILSAILQAIYPTLLLSSLALVLMILFVYLSFENPKENIDQLTQAFNQRALRIMLNENVESGKYFQVISVTVEDFSRINSAYGYEKGTGLLKQIAAFLQKITNTNVYQARGNVLSVILKRRHPFSQKQQEKLMRYLSSTFVISGVHMMIRAHIDVIDVTDPHFTVDEILENIDFMSKRKSAVSDSTPICYYDEDAKMQKHRRQTIEEIIRQAILNDGFRVVYQPIYNVKEKVFSSAEALVRLADTETIGFISPEEFITIAEERGLIMELGRIVFEKVCQFAKQEKLSEKGIHYIEVNLSGIQCVSDELSTQLKSIMATYGISPDFINLEITETAMIQSGEKLLLNMKELRDLGCSFSMDDFGTGYSNLSLMADITYDLIKLDKSLIWPCFEDENPKAVAILESIITMLQKLHIKIVAEGTETEEQVDYLSKMGVDYLQGYYYSKPIPEQDYISFITEKNSL